MRSAYLQFERVRKIFGGLPVVDRPFSLDIDKGQFIAFLGPSGCGKSTLMRMVGGLDYPSGGRISLEGRAVNVPDRSRGMVFQSYSSFPWLTVEQNVAFGMRYRQDLTAAEKCDRCAHYLALVGLSEFGGAYPNRVSGGMRQRIAIARSLAAGSEVLLMDEPFGALDAQRRESLQVALREIQQKEAKTIIFVTHDVDEAVFLADRIIVLAKRPTYILEDLNITAELGAERTLAIRDGQRFFEMRNRLLQMMRNIHSDDEAD
ncbi:ABC transporter ATP-binding protein [Rhizobium pusense]|uniref:ABC transporter ATP-binding protein n=1 Tax=Agrobacterium pusense TaxID=648995 RepID=UPI002449CB06|nr:ABC transporter ATP-binding protein [Agrobacterium pusense]MDH2091630.1 ABC transporter ATP-binding protein [Agrobacterium pusense]